MGITLSLKYYNKETSPVKCSVRYRGQLYPLSTGISVPVQYWIRSEKRCKTGRVFPEGSHINKRLSKYVSEVYNLFQQYEIEYKRPTLQQAKKDLEELQTGGKNVKGLFLPYLKEVTVNSGFQYETTKKYITCYNKLLEFEQEFWPLKFEDIDIKFYERFRKWLGKKNKNEGKEDAPFEHYSLNYFGSLIKVVKKVMNKGLLDGEHSTTGFKHKEFTVPNETSDSIYLTLEELLKIHRMKIDMDYILDHYKGTHKGNAVRIIESANIVKNKFLIGAFTALRISDFNRLSEVNIKNDIISIKPQKGTKKNENVYIPIHPVVRDILNSGFDISTPLSDQKLNEHIKEICQHAGINEPCEKTITLCTGEQITSVHQKYELVSSHTCRRSGATNMFLAGIPSLSIMKITGHRTERSFLKYIKVSNEENAFLIKNHPFFKSH